MKKFQAVTLIQTKFLSPLRKTDRTLSSKIVRAEIAKICHEFNNEIVIFTIQ